MFLMLVLLGSVLGVWWYFNPERRPNLPTVNWPTTTPTPTSSASAMVAAMPKAPAKGSHEFRQWLAEATLAKRLALYKSLPTAADDFKHWLAALPETEHQAFAQQAAEFCAQEGIEPSWLTDPNAPAELRTAAQETATLYCLARWKAHQAKSGSS